MKFRLSQLTAILILTIIGSLIFLFHYSFTDSYLSSPEGIAFELRTSTDSLYTWKISEEAPFKYRVLFPEVVLSTWKALRESPNDNEGFITVYRSWSFLFYLAAIITFYQFLRTLKLPPREVFTGTIIYMALPAMSFAFSFPVHTREDLLGYALLNLGLIAMIKEQRIFFVLVAIAAGLCRETLLILPLVYLIRSTDKWPVRVLISAIPIAAWLVLRWKMGYEKYDALGLGLKDNVENIFQTGAFLLMTFNILWLPFLFSLISRPSSSKEMTIIYRTAWLSLVLIVLSTFVLGRVMEIRLLYLLAPWIIPVFVTEMASRHELLRLYTQSRVFIIVSLGGLFLITAAYGMVWILRPHLYSMMRDHWWVVLFISLQLCVMGLPFLRSWKKGEGELTQTTSS